jgi:hypothetical protein
MALGGDPAEISDQDYVGSYIKLPSQRIDDSLRDTVVGSRKRPEKPGAAQHDREPKAAMVTAQFGDDVAVELVQMEIPRQLLRRRVSDKTRKGAPLIVGEVLCGHGYWNSQNSRKRRGEWPGEGYSSAKDMRETKSLCNKLRAGLRASA